jgi:hypothetical protein
MNFLTILGCILLGFGASIILTMNLATSYVRKLEKQTFWINIYKNEDGLLFSDRMVDTEREAIFDAAGRKDYIKRMKIKI